MFFCFCFFFISLITDGPQRCHRACGHLRIFPSLPGSRLTNFHRDASSALLQLVIQWLNFTYSRFHAFRYTKERKQILVTRIELTTSAPPVLSTCPLHTISGCGKERRILVDLPRQHSFRTALRFTGPVPADSRQ